MIGGSAEDETSPWLGCGHSVKATVHTNGIMLVGIVTISMLLVMWRAAGRPLMEAETQP